MFLYHVGVEGVFTVSALYMKERRVRVSDGRRAHLLLADQREDVERQEEAVQQVIGQDVVQELAVDDEDVVQVVQVVQVLRHQVAQLPSVLMSGGKKSERTYVFTLID